MTPSTRRALNWGVPILVVLAIVGFLLEGADRPADPRFALGAPAPDTSLSVRTPQAGFGEVSFRIDATGVLFGSGGSVSAARCALLAATFDTQAQGLMGRRDLAGYDGMIFRFDSDTEGSFFMKDTLIPLSIAFFDSEGRFVSAADMEPCGDQDPCPTYGPDGPYRYALEVLQGGLPALAIGPGSRLLLGVERC